MWPSCYFTSEDYRRLHRRLRRFLSKLTTKARRFTGVRSIANVDSHTDVRVDAYRDAHPWTADAPHRRPPRRPAPLAPRRATPRPPRRPAPRPPCRRLSGHREDQSHGKSVGGTLSAFDPLTLSKAPRKGKKGSGHFSLEDILFLKESNLSAFSILVFSRPHHTQREGSCKTIAAPPPPPPPPTLPVRPLPRSATGSARRPAK